MERKATRTFIMIEAELAQAVTYYLINAHDIRISDEPNLSIIGPQGPNQTVHSGIDKLIIQSYDEHTLDIDISAPHSIAY